MIGSGSQSMLFTHRMHVYLDDVAGGGCMMALMRESSSCGSVAAEPCVRKTIGGGSREFLLKTLYLQTHRHTHTFRKLYTHTHFHTPLMQHTHKHKYTLTHIHISTYTYKHTHTFSQPHTNFHINTQTVHILILAHRHAYLHTFIRSLAQSPVSQSSQF